LSVPLLEKELGIEVYASETPGIGGRIRQFPEDFIVEEILVDGSEAKVLPVSTPQIVGRGRYLVCVLVKRNWDTLRAVRNIAKRLGIREEYVQIGGIKDAKALTAQHVSISCFTGVTPDQVLRMKTKDIILYPQRFSNEKISSQLLLGNRFNIKIRAISCSSSTVKRRIKNVLRELADLGGIPNFFGHQRFGTIRPITHKVGKFIVKGNWEKAALTFLYHSSLHEHPQSRKARQQLQISQDFKEAQKYFPRTLHYERSMLNFLAKHPRDYVGAFRKLPLKLCRLFIQAYQSFLFNKFLSQRIRREISTNTAQIGDYAINLDSHGLPTASFTQVTAQSLQSVQKAINENEMRIAIPLIGFKQHLSSGIQGEIEKEILETENLTPKDFKISSMPQISAPGGLRTILTPVISLSIGELSEDSANPSSRALKLDFMLYRGSYATVLLREFMKPRDLIEASF
jgi:tRNA pseudouridine13 synthase